jgi:prepilin-type N-terminal cleavage/methylation domain-containing protein
MESPNLPFVFGAGPAPNRPLGALEENPLHNPGFTLVEMVVVVVVLGILAAVFVPRSNTDAIILSTQTEQFAADIRYAQSLAMTQGWSGVSPARRTYSITYTATTYSFVDGSGIAVTHPSGQPSPIRFAGGVSISPFPPNPALGNVVSFDGRGIPYSDVSATNALASMATISMVGSGGSIRAIRIYPNTGMVDVP